MRKTQNNRKLWLLAGFVCVAACSGGVEGGGGGPPPHLLPPLPPAPLFEFNGSVSPNPIISRNKPTRSSTGQAAMVNDGRYRWAGSWSTGGQAAWVAIHIGHGESRLLRRVLFSWNSGPNYNYLEPTGQNNGFPTAYEIWVSSDSGDGSNGTWTRLVNENGNRVRTRTHLLEWEGGIAWVRLNVLAGPTVHLDEIDIHDASNGSYDSWFFLGDSITAHAFDRSTAHGSFAELIHARWGSFFPAMVDGGVGGDKTEQALARLNSALEQHPAIQFWAICLGSNNVGTGNDGWGLETFRSQLLEIVKRIQAAGRIAVIPSIPFIGRLNGQTCRVERPDVPKFNAAIQELIAQTGALPGPDLYAYFAANCGQLPDGLHPNAEGYQAMNRLWAEAMEPIYRAQQ